MSLFSQRMGLKPMKRIIQKDLIDDNLKNGLWNVLIVNYWSMIPEQEFISKCAGLDVLTNRLWVSYFKKPLDTLDDWWPDTYKYLRKYFYSCEWNEIYDFIEFIANNGIDKKRNEVFKKSCNVVLKKELSAYRFIGEVITPVINECEVEEIDEALKSTHSMKPIQNHLQTALKYLSDRKNPDYRNSIKESISAVEGLCNILNGTTSTLGKTLNDLEKKIGIHGAFKQGLSSLYGWTSSDEGIRHALMKESELDFEDAKFMLVSCSAFINYLMVKAEKADLLK